MIRTTQDRMSVSELLGSCITRPLSTMTSIIAVLLPVTTVHGQGMPFQVQDYVAQAPNTVISLDVLKTSRAVGGDNSALRRLGWVVRNLDEPVSAAPSQRELSAQAEVLMVSQDRPDEVSAQSFIETNDVVKEGAAWLKVKFQEVDLGASRLVISSPVTNQSQAFTADQLKEWNGYSALFSGDRLRFQLQVADGSKEPPPLDELVEQLVVGSSLLPEKPYADEQEEDAPEQQAELTEDEEEACGIDDRRASENMFVGRMRPAMCTVFLLEGGIYASAGHCFRDNRELQNVEFNVGPSTETGIPSDADFRHIYPVIANSIVCSDCVPPNLKHGKDWAVFLVGRNPETGKTPHEAQGRGYKILVVPQLNGQPVKKARVDGYGWDNDPLTSTYANQQARGTFLGVVGVAADDDVEVGHLVDTEGGNSGSPILAIDANGKDTDFVIGIHTGGKCDPPNNKPNKGTGFSNNDLTKAVDFLRERVVSAVNR
jgi:hypothetical protein